MAYESMIIFEVSFPWLEGPSPMGLSQDMKDTTAALEADSAVSEEVKVSDAVAAKPQLVDDSRGLYYPMY